MQGRTLQILVAGALVLLGTACAQGPAQAPTSTSMPVASGAGQAPGQMAGAVAPPGTNGAAPTPGMSNSGSGNSNGGSQSGPPKTTAAPVTTMPPPPPPTIAVAFVTKLPIDNPNAFYTQVPKTNNPQGLTFNNLWCYNLVQANPGANCQATAYAASVAVDTIMSFPPTAVTGTGSNQVSPAQAAMNLQNQLTAIQNGAVSPNSPMLIDSSVFGIPVVSGIQSLSLPTIPVGAPTQQIPFPQTQAAAGAPSFQPTVTAPTVAPTPKNVTFTTLLTKYNSPTDFTTLATGAVRSPNDQWCYNLRQRYQSATNCYNSNIRPGSVAFETNMIFSANDNQAGALLALLQEIQEGKVPANDLFDTTAFGDVSISGVPGAAIAAAPSPAPAPAPSHKLSGGKIAGAVIGSVAGAAILAGCGYGGYKYFHHRQSYQQAGLA